MIALDGVEYEIRAHSWQEKLRMSRFASLGEPFLQSSFLECCVADAAGANPEHREVLLALAMWVNLPDEDTPALPLDPRQLARVTLEVCRSMGVGPAAIGSLPVPEVEILWHGLEHGVGGDRIERAFSAPEYDYKIVVLPDRAKPQEVVAEAAPPPAESRGTSVDEAPAQSRGRSGDEAPVEAPGKDSPRLPAAQARFRVSLDSGVPERRGVSEARGGGEQGRQDTAPARAVGESPSDTLGAAPVRRGGPVSSNEWSDAVSPASPAQAAVAGDGLDQAESRAHRGVDPLDAIPAARAQTGLEVGPWPKGPPTRRPPAVSSLPSAVSAENRNPSSGPGRPFADIRGESAFFAPSGMEPASGEPAFAPDLASVQAAASMESLIDEFCRQLDEAAADLGILEEM